MSGLRGSHMFSNVRVDSLRYQSKQIPAGTTGYALSIGADGVIGPNGALATATLNVSDSATVGNTLTASTVDAANITVTDTICTNNLIVNGVFQPGITYVSGLADTFFGNAFVVGTTDTCHVPGASLDVLGSAVFHEGLSTTFVRSADLFTDVLTIGKSGVTGALVFKNHDGVDIAHIAPAATGLNISTIDYHNHLIVSGVTGTSAGLSVPYITGFAFLDIDPSGRQVSINSGTLNVSTISANLGDSAGISMISPVQTTAGLQVVGGLTVTGPFGVSGPISNPLTNQPVLVGDNMSVIGALTVGSTVTASGAMRVSGNLTAAGGLTASNLLVRQKLTVDGYLAINEIRDAVNSALNVSPNLSINTTAGSTKGTGILYAGAIKFPTASTGKLIAQSGDLQVTVPSGQAMTVSSGNNTLGITPMKGAGQDIYMQYGGTAGKSLYIQPSSGFNGAEFDSNGNLNVNGDLYVPGDATIGNLTISSLLTLGSSGIAGSLVAPEAVTVGGNTYMGYRAQIGNFLVRWVTTGAVGMNPQVTWATPFANGSYIVVGSATYAGTVQPVGFFATPIASGCQLRGAAGSSYTIGFIGQSA